MAFFKEPERNIRIHSVNTFLTFLIGSSLSGPQNRLSSDIHMYSICAPKLL